MKSTNYIGSIFWPLEALNQLTLLSTVNVDFEWVNTVTSQVSFQVVGLNHSALLQNFLRCSMLVIMLMDSKDLAKLMKSLLILTLMVIQLMSELKCLFRQEHKSI